MPFFGAAEASSPPRWTTVRIGEASLTWLAGVAGKQGGGLMPTKATRKQLPLFSVRTDSALWLQLLEAQRVSIVGQYARLIARAAKVAPAPLPVMAKEDQ